MNQEINAHSSNHKTQQIPLLILYILYSFIIIRDAWLSDDAYITFRTIDNFINGYGLTWNISERVQVYTHPLWMFLNSSFYVLTHEIYLTNILLSITISIITIILLTTLLPQSKTGAFLGIIILISSRAYIDYSTSGLENPLTHLLLVIFFVIYFRQAPSHKSLVWLSFVAALAAVNRMDTLLLFLPAIVFRWWQHKDKKAIGKIIIGFLPFILWISFATFYYGFPFPNTAYAKLNTGIPVSEVIEQGFYYFINSLWMDPITLIIITTSLFMVAFFKKKMESPLAIGIILYLFYIIKIGGDFMSGRFFTAPLLCAVVLIIHHKFDSITNSIIQFMFATIIIIGLSGIHPTLIPKSFNIEALRDKRGIADERAVYTPFTGLINLSRTNNLPNFKARTEGLQAQKAEQRVFTKLSIGMFAFYGGESIHVIDYYALADPLLARLPSARTITWRIGHFGRRIPEGYIETLESGQNRLTDPALAEYYDKLSYLTRGDLFDKGRLIEIWRFNSGQYDHLINFDTYRYPKMIRIPLHDVTVPIPEGTALNNEKIVIFTAHGIEIDMETTVFHSVIEIALDNNDDYQLIYFNGQEEIAQQTLLAPYAPDGLTIHKITIPRTAVTNGFNRLRILPIQGDDVYGLGYINLRD